MNVTDEILLRRKHLVTVIAKDYKYEQTSAEKATVVAMMKNVQSLGFTFSKKLFGVLSHLTYNELNALYPDLIKNLKCLVGADVVYNPMYPNFPRQVADASEAELFINAIIHYWSCGTISPRYKNNERMPLIDDDKMTVLSVGKHKDLMEIFANLVSSKTSLSKQDKDDIAAIIKECTDFPKFMPETIPLKENVAYIGKLVIENSPLKSSKPVQKYFKTATDVLRLIVAMSDGDISLAKKTKFRKMRRRERRMILNILAGCNNLTEDMFRYKNEWIRVGEIIHPGEYKLPKYRSIISAFNTLRNEKKPLMFAGKVQKAILEHDIHTAAKLLKNRPGDFARQLDKLVREEKNPSYVIGCFREVAKEVSSPVLLQVRQHFIGRMSNKDNPIRVFFPKGNLAKATSIKNELPEIADEYCKEIALICRNALIEQYKSKEPLGKVYVDPDLKNYIVPFSQRSASKAVKTFVRGSKIPVSDNAKAVRAFIWWTNIDDSDYFSRVDIDLSAAVYDENWGYIEHVSYTNLRSAKFKMYHSGDITNGGNASGDGVAEFLDIDIESVAKNARYVVFQVHDFSCYGFAKLPNCRFGWMEREDVNSGEIFEPKTVKMKMDLTADSATAIPVIFDCVERKFIWCDMNLEISSTRYGGNNLESNLGGVTATCYGIAHMNKPNLYDLAMLNAKARGIIVADRNEADIIFSNDTTKPVVTENVYAVKNGVNILRDVVTKEKDTPIITAFDVDYAMGQLL